MKRLYILRHAKSSWAEPGLGDFDRALNKRGDRQLIALSRWFSDRDDKPRYVLCSSAVRTRKTFEGIATALDHPTIETMDELYNGTMDSYLDAIWTCEHEGPLMLIGHNPTCDELVRLLTRPSSPAATKLMSHHFGTATLAVFDVDLDGWSDLGEASCSLIALIRPKELEATATL